jgi:hypothetical protein
LEEGRRTMATDSFDELVHRIRNLPIHEQRELLHALSNSVAAQSACGTRSLLELKGLGRHVWQGIDAQQYVRQERASWTG